MKMTDLCREGYKVRNYQVRNRVQSDKVRNYQVRNRFQSEKVRNHFRTFLRRFETILELFFRRFESILELILRQGYQTRGLWALSDQPDALVRAVNISKNDKIKF
jgi:hypothetical protein